MTLYAYARKSTLGQSETTITEQLAKCKAIAQLRGAVGKYDYQSFTDDGVSGSIPLHARPGGKAMLAQLKPGDIVCAAKMDRVFRSGVDALTTIEKFKQRGYGLILCDMGIEPVADSPSATLFFSMLASFAEFERARINERILEGKRAKKSLGGHVGGPTPRGYRKVDAGKKAILVKDETEQEHIEAARWYAKQMKHTPSQIARLLTDDGMLGRDGKPYTRVAVFRMINGRRKMLDHVPGNPDRGQLENVWS